MTNRIFPAHDPDFTVVNGVYVHKSHPLYTHHYNCSCDACANCAIACPFCGCLCVTIDCELCGCEDVVDLPVIDFDQMLREGLKRSDCLEGLEDRDDNCGR